jgi:hypothetical protein
MSTTYYKIVYKESAEIFLKIISEIALVFISAISPKELEWIEKVRVRFWKSL